MQTSKKQSNWDIDASGSFGKCCSDAGEEGCKKQGQHQTNRLWLSLWIVQSERVSKSSQLVDVPWRSFIIFSISLVLTTSEYFFLNLGRWVSICLLV